MSASLADYAVHKSSCAVMCSWSGCGRPEVSGCHREYWVPGSGVYWHEFTPKGDCTCGLADLVKAGAHQWQPIETAPKDGTLIIGALIRDGRIWRIHDMKHNGLAFYTVSGGSLPQMTHWILPAPPEAK